VLGVVYPIPYTLRVLAVDGMSYAMHVSVVE
jgi:hypothetical protein